MNKKTYLKPRLKVKALDGDVVMAAESTSMSHSNLIITHEDESAGDNVVWSKGSDAWDDTDE